MRPLLESVLTYSDTPPSFKRTVRSACAGSRARWARARRKRATPERSRSTSAAISALCAPEDPVCLGLLRSRLPDGGGRRRLAAAPALDDPRSVIDARLARFSHRIARAAGQAPGWSCEYVHYAHLATF